MRFFYAILSVFSFVSIVSSSTPTTQIIQSHPLSQKIQTPVHPVIVSRVTNEPIKKVVYNNPHPAKKVVYSNPQPAKKVIHNNPQPVKKVVYSNPQPAKKVVYSNPQPAKKVVHNNPQPAKKVVHNNPQPVKKYSSQPDSQIYMNRLKNRLNEMKQKKGKHVYIKDNDVKAYCQIFFTK